MNASTFTTGEVRASFVHLFTPDAAPGGDPAYSIMALIPKSDVATLTAYKAAYEDAVNYGIQKKWNGALPPVLLGGLADGDGVKNDGTPYGPECKGCYVLKCKSNVENKPLVVDQRNQEILDSRKVYSGCYVRVNVTLVPYNNNSKGITSILNAVQFVRDGEPFGGGQVTAAEAFGAPAAMPAAPGYVVPGYASAPAPVPAPAYTPPVAAPAYPQQPPAAYPQQTAPMYSQQAPAYPQQWPVDPITGQPVPNGMPVMGM
ncbi:ssDNA-binding protein [Oscillibacter sp.]|uniref:DUF2815 family protein n=1 Tax=Oscillibacter sp. TaxID=1945593 RepID=UPI0028A20FC2|nr:ssDNA-binding protein [Oscillibacter sp.]